MRPYLSTSLQPPAPGDASCLRSRSQEIFVGFFFDNSQEIFGLFQGSSCNAMQCNDTILYSLRIQIKRRPGSSRSLRIKRRSSAAAPPLDLFAPGSSISACNYSAPRVGRSPRFTPRVRRSPSHVVVCVLKPRAARVPARIAARCAARARPQLASPLAAPLAACARRSARRAHGFIALAAPLTLAGPLARKPCKMRRCTVPCKMR